MENVDITSPTPKDVILHKKEFEKQKATYSTTLQRNSLIIKHLYIKWKVEIKDVDSGYSDYGYRFVIDAIVRLRDPWSWLRGIEFDGDFDLRAYIKQDFGLDDIIRKLNRGQKIWIEGQVSYFSRSFTIEDAKISF